MGKLGFNDIALIEIIRHLESVDDSGAAMDRFNSQVSSRNDSFQQKLGTRARLLSQEWALPEKVAKAAGLFGFSKLVLAGLFGLMGMLAALQAFPANQEAVNFFWLLMVLLGIHFLSLVIWLASLVIISLKTIKPVESHWFLRLVNLISKFLPGQSSTSTGQQQVNAAWLQVHSHAWPGFWRLSRVTHSCWSAYLAGGLLMIIIMLSARQYDFVWETTILSETAFQALTHWLSIGPGALGFVIPDAEIVSLSRRGVAPDALFQFREAWAGLLVGSLLLYGLLIRIVCLVLTGWLQKFAESRVSLELTLPYYVCLRQDLAPPTLSLGIVDADEAPPIAASAKNHAPSNQQPPTDALWFGLELGTAANWPPLPLQSGNDLGLIDDRASRLKLKQQLDEMKWEAVVIVVELQRTPDRGITRLIIDLQARFPKNAIWIALLESTPQESHQIEMRERLVGWYQLAAASHLPDDRVIVISKSQENPDD